MRSWLDRNGVAAGLYLAHSPRGIDLLAGELRDVSRLPAVLLWNGAVLVTPADDELATALGAPTRPVRQHYDGEVRGREHWLSVEPAGLRAAEQWIGEQTAFWSRRAEALQARLPRKRRGGKR